MKLATIIHFAQPAFTIHEQPEQLPELGCAGLRWVALGCAGRPGTFSGLRWVALGRAELGCAQLGATSAAILVGSIPGGAARGVSLRLPWTSLHMAPKDIPTKTELPSPAKNPGVQTGCTPFAVPKTLPKPADAPTPPTVPAADESSTGNNLQGDCADAPDTAPRKELVGVENAKQIGAMKPPTKKRSASCRGEDGEDDEDGEECAAATKLRRGEDGEEGQTRIVTGACYDPRFDPDRIEEVYTRKKGWVFRRRLERL